MIETSKTTDTGKATAQTGRPAAVSASQPQSELFAGALPPLPEAIRTKLRTAAAAMPPAQEPVVSEAEALEPASVTMTGMMRRLREQVARVRAQGVSADASKRAVARLRARVNDLAAVRPKWSSVSKLPLPQISPEFRDGLVKQGRRVGLNIGATLDKIIREVPKAAAETAPPAPTDMTGSDADISTIAVRRAVKQPSIFGPAHILTALLAGGIIHIATTFAVISLGTGSAFHQLAPALPVNELVVLPAQAPGMQLLPFLPPDMLYAICRFDLRTGPLEVNAMLPEAGWSLALYTRQGDNFYAAPGQSQRPVPVAFVLTQATDRLVNLAPGVRKSDVDISQVTSPDAEGLMVVRAPLKGVAFTSTTRADLQRASCTPLRR